MKNKYLLFLTFLLIFLFYGFRFALALELKYPVIPTLPNINQNSDITSYVRYFFGLGIYMAGILAVISFAVGAVTLIISADNTSLASEGKERMKSAVLGLVLTLAAFIIMSTINPTITTPVLTKLPPTTGVYFTDGSVYMAATPSNATIQAGFNKLIYICGNGGGKNVLVWNYPQQNRGGIENSFVSVLTCGNSVSVNTAGSLDWAYDQSGVYFCMGGCAGNLCKGGMSSVINNSQDAIDSIFSGKIGGVRIVNDPANDTYYGVIFHDTQGLNNGGECTYPITTKNPSACVDTDVAGYPISAINPVAANIFTINTDASSGNGVNFYSEPNGWTANLQGQRTAGFYKVAKDQINPIFSQDAGKMCFDYTHIAEPEAYKYKCPEDPGFNGDCPTNPNDNADTSGDATGTHVPTCGPSACQTFQDCPGSIEMRAEEGYLVGIYSEDAIANKVYCQIFTDTVPYLGVQDIVAPGSFWGENGVDGTVYIIRTK